MEEKNINAHPLEVYAFRNEEKIQLESSSGGAFSAVLDYFFSLENGEHVVYGACFNDQFEVVHQAAYSIKECDKFRGSKYVVSKLGNCFKEIKEDLKVGKYVLFSGTPCQVDALNTYLDRNNTSSEKLFTVDIICHGTPSQLLWKDYVKWLETINKSNLTFFSFRWKKAKWKEYPVKAEFANGRCKENTQDVRMFTTLFFSHAIFRECCYSCKHSNLNRHGDVTLGDFWGFEQVMPVVSKKWNARAKDGISLVLINSEKGKIMWKHIVSNESYNVERCTSADYLLYQNNLNRPTKRSDFTEDFRKDYEKYGFGYIAKKYGAYNVKGRIRYCIRKICHEIYDTIR